MLTTSAVRADRVPSHKTVIPRDPGVRGDITVPYTTNGYTTLGVYQGVAPRIYATPIVEDLKQPQTRPVFNLIFYGATQSFGDGNEGCTCSSTPVAVASFGTGLSSASGSSTRRIFCTSSSRLPRFFAAASLGPSITSG